MKTLAVARKSCIEILREPQLLALSILGPLIFLAATIASYSRPFLATHPIMVINSAPGGAMLIDEIKAARYPDGRAAFEITEIADAVLAEPALKDNSATVLVKIDPGDPTLSVTLRGDALNNRYYEATALLDNIIQRYANRLAGESEAVHIVERPLQAGGVAQAGPQKEYDLYVPGMIVFAILLLIPQTAMPLGREVRAGTLRRLRLSQLSASQLLAGVGAAQLLVAVVQVAVVLVSAVAMGFHNEGSVWLAIVIGVAISFSAIGQGLVVACFVANDSQAINYGSVVTMIQVFISGAFFPMPASTLLTIAGHEMTLFDLLPATHGMLLLQQTLCYGMGWNAIAFRLAVMMGLSLAYFAAGAVVFNHLQMKRP